MTKDEYVKQLVAGGGYTSQQIYDMGNSFKGDEPAEEVKTNDPAVNAEASAGSENNTASQSEDGSSESPTIMPGQVITKGGYEHKYQIDPETKQGVYYRRPAGKDVNWTNLGEDDSESGMLDKASTAYHFGHSDMSASKRKKYEDQIKARNQHLKDVKEARLQYARDEKLGWAGMITGGDGLQFSDIFDFRGFGHEKGWNIFADDARWGEATARFIGEGVELAVDTIDFATDRIMDVTLEPIAGALNAAGILDLSDYEDDSFVGIEFDNVINDIVSEFVVGDAAYTGQKDALGREKGKYDFGEEVGDLVESGMLSIGAGMMAMPQLLADTKKMIGESMGDFLPPGAQAFLHSPLMHATMPGLANLDSLTQGDIVKAGEEAYNIYSKKANQLNLTLADFGPVGMSEMMGEAFVKYEKDASGEYVLDKNGDKKRIPQSLGDRLKSFVAGSTRITASALGSLPSVAQSMVPYVGIASIVAGEAARTNMESKQDGRPLNWARLGHAYTTGASEGLLELVTKKIGMGMFKGLRGGGKEVIEQTLRQYGTKVMKEFGQEGLSELGTLLINQAADKLYKDEVDEWFPAWGEVIDTFLIGGVMGGGMSSVGVGGQMIRNTIARKNIKGNLNSAGFKKLSTALDSINPFSEGGLSQEIASGMEDSTSERQRLQDTKRIKQVDEIKNKPSKTEIQKTSEIARNDAMENAVIENTADNIKEQNVVETVSIKNGKPVTELTVDEKSDAFYKVLTNPSTEMFLNTELKREVEAGNMTTTKAEEIKANFKAQQGAANQMKGSDLTGQQRQKVISLLAEEKNLQETIKQRNNKALTEKEQARVDEINNELSTISNDAYNQKTAEQQAKIDEGVEKDIDYTKKVTEGEDGTFNNAVGENKSVQTWESTKEFLEFAKDNNIEADAYTDAIVLENGQILINKQHMREAGAIGAGRHEVLHKILKSQFTGVNLKNGKAEKLKDQFLKILEETDPEGYKLLMDTITYSEDGYRLYSDEYLKDNPDEYLTIYASLLMEKKIPLETFEKKPSLIKRLSNFFSNIFADAANENPAGTNVKASDIGFKDGKDLYNFVKGYVKDSESGVLSDRAQKLSDQGREGSKSKTSKSKKPTISKARQADLDKMTPNQRLALEGKGPLTMIRDADGKLVMGYGPIAETLDGRKSPYKNVKGRSGIPKFSKTKKATPLEAINDLIPASIKTKEQFDAFMRDNKTALPIASALLPGGVINNYIRSRETSREQGDKMIDEMYERIFNFNPEATRADGTIVGPKGFGESIFANTRFAKMVANKALAEKSEKQKQEKRIDSKEAKEVADDTKETKVKDDKLAKKPSETTGLDKQTEAKITKAVNKWAKTIEGDIGFAETRNIPQAVAEIYGEMFGFNPETLVDKKRNFQKTDARGLTKAKQFLIKNAQSDHARMVELKNDMGKGTFVPNNVKNALFKDGKFTGTLKQYLDLINEKATKPIYRDRTAQTIKGLLALHIRNRMLETAQPVQGKRIQSGAKFSRSIIRKNSLHNLTTKYGLGLSLKDAAQMTNINQIMKMLGVPMKTINDDNRKTIVDDFVNSISTNEAIITPLIARLNLSNFGASNFTGKDWGNPNNKKIRLKERNEWSEFKSKNKVINSANYYRVDKGKGDYTFIIGEKYINKKGKTAYRKPSQEVLVKKFGKKGVTPPPPNFVPARGGMFHGTNDPNYIKAMDAARINDKKNSNKQAIKDINAAKRINIDPATGKPDPKGKNPKTGKTWTKAELDTINKKARNATLNQIKQAVKNGMPIETAGMLVNKGYQGTNSIFKITIPFVGESTLIMTQGGLTEKAIKLLAREGGPFSEITTEEHSPPVSMNMGQWMVALAYDMANMNSEGEFTTDETNVIEKAIDRNAIQVVLDIATDVALNENGFRDKILEGQTIKTRNVAWNRLNRANHEGNPSPLEKIELEDGRTAADKTGITPNPKFSKSFKNNPSALNYQQKLINDNAIDPEALTTKDAKDRLNISMPVQILKNDRVIKNSELNPDIMVPTVTAEKMKTVMVNSFETRVKASKSNPKRKGISVFDFDDTLARTKEKVIVNMIDGTTKEISAAQFAKQAGTLTEQGAEFDFSNFENVAKGTKEGPLADLARKRQGKFGSGDIFVLTARPNSAGPAIQAFLKSIGIDIPLQNITGLSDGTPQAKADWVLNKTAEGYNDFYFADDSFANVAGVKAVLDAVDVKNKVQQAKFSKSKKLNTEINKILEEVTGTKAFKKYSTVRARLEGKKKDGGLFKRFLRQFTITPSADDFAGLTYAFRGTGEQGNRHAKWIEDNLIKPYNKAELELMSAKIAVANDFAALKKQFPSLKTKRNTFGIKRNPLLAQTGIGPFTKSQAVRVYMWNKQGMEIPGMSKRDIADLVKFVEGDNELNVFADEVILIQKDGKYPAPKNNWMAGDMKSDILNGMDKGFRQKLLTEWNENIEAVFTPELYNKLEALYGSKYIEALKDSIRRMRSGSNRPVYTGGGARIVNDMLDWLNASVGVTMFINQKSGLLQTLSSVNFINWGDNNIYAAAKAFASADFYPTFLKLMNSDYLVNRRDGLKINVNEAELVDAGKKGGFQGMVSFLLDKGFVITRIMDSLAIASGGATFFINRKAAMQKRTNPETGKLYTEAEAEAQAFQDFYAIAEETQQSSNPSKISQQQASLAGRVLLSFQNVTMQFNRKTKKSILDFVKRRRKPGMTQRESDMSNLSSVMYYVGMQNLIFHSLQQALFAGLFDDEEEKEKNRGADIANGMLDSLLFGLGFGGAFISTLKNVTMRMYEEHKKKSPDYEEPLWDLFDVSPVIDSKIRKLRQAAKSFSWNMKEIKRRGWSLDNPAYLAISQIISAFFNLPVDRVMNITNNMRNAMDEETRMWQKIALTLGWSPYILNLPYWGRQSTIDKEAKEDAKLKENYKKQIQRVKKKGFTKKIPLSGPNHYKPEGQSGVDFMQVERPDGTIQYYVKP